MRIELESHKGVILENPVIEIISTADFPTEQKFKPSILLTVEPNIRIYHDLPMFDYIDGSWTDEDVENVINNYLPTLEIE